MIGYKFKSEEQFQHWCYNIMLDIYCAGISMDDERVREITSEVLSKIHTTEGYDLIKIDGTEYEDEEDVPGKLSGAEEEAFQYRGVKL